MKNILVTGGCGFIGTNFIRLMLDKYDYNIINLDLLTYAGNRENLKDKEKDKRYVFYKGDILNAKLVEKIIKKHKIDTIVHFAAESHVDRSINDAHAFLETNILGTHVLLELARKYHLRFHHISTDEVFGSIALTEDKIWTEESSYNPRSPHSASKAASDHLVRAYGATYNLPFTISNCANNYGPYLYPEKLLSLAITNVLEGKKIPVYTPGNQIREWLYVEDHCSAIDTILQKGKIGETYFIGPSDPHITNLELVKKLLARMGVGEDVIEFVADRPGHDQKYALSTKKIETELGWKSNFTLDEGLQKTIDWYKENEPWWKKIKSGEYRKYYEEQYRDTIKD